MSTFGYKEVPVPYMIHLNVLWAVLRIRIRRFLGLLDPDLDQLVKTTAPDPSIIKQKSKKILDYYCFVTSLWLFIFEKWCKCTFNKKQQKNLI
jgi:hypothetical protein